MASRPFSSGSATTVGFALRAARSRASSGSGDLGVLDDAATPASVGSSGARLALVRNVLARRPHPNPQRLQRARLSPVPRTAKKATPLALLAEWADFSSPSASERLARRRAARRRTGRARPSRLRPRRRLGVRGRRHVAGLGAASESLGELGGALVHGRLRQLPADRLSAPKQDEFLLAYLVSLGPDQTDAVEARRRLAALLLRCHADHIPRLVAHVGDGERVRRLDRDRAGRVRGRLTRRPRRHAIDLGCRRSCPWCSRRLVVELDRRNDVADAPVGGSTFAAYVLGGSAELLSPVTRTAVATATPIASTHRHDRLLDRLRPARSSVSLPARPRRPGDATEERRGRDPRRPESRRPAESGTGTHLAGPLRPLPPSIRPLT